MNNRILLIVIIISLAYPLGYGQEVFQPEESLDAGNYRYSQMRREFSPDPRKASMYSAVLPGMGQIYNRKYWKVPIIYGGFAALTWYTFFSHDQFVRYRDALDFRMDGNPLTVDEFTGDPRYTNDVLTRFKDYYRRQRDQTIIYTAIFYALNIVDAAVDAHLFEFDVSEDLGMKIGPSFNGPDHPLVARPSARHGVGLRFSINF